MILNGLMSNRIARLALLMTIIMSSFAKLEALSMTLMNDSVFPLTANIFNAMGNKEGSVNLAPGQSYIWYGNDGSFRPLDNSTTTPYTVRWVCNAGRPYDYSTKERKKNEKVPPKYQSDFAVWEAVPISATVTAQGCPSGRKTCVVKRRQKQPGSKKPSRVHKVPPRHYTKREPRVANDGMNRFSNDGGLTWTNDGGDPFADFDKEYFTEDQEAPSSEENVQ